MANPEHLEILKQGVEVWNRWRKRHPFVGPDLREADLRGLDLTGVNFKLAFKNRFVAIGSVFAGETVSDVVESGSAFRTNLCKATLANANLLRADLFGADLCGADLSAAELRETRLACALLNGANLQNAKLYEADLSDAHLHGTNLSGAKLNDVDLRQASLCRTNLIGASLRRADLRRAHLKDVNLRKADLKWADFNSTYLKGVNFDQAWFESNTFAFTNLSGNKGLETARHSGPSSIGVETFYRSKGDIPETFLRGCGVPDNFIAYVRSLTAQPIQFYSCFISHSSKDQGFAERLNADLQSRGVRCWFAPEDLKIGAEIRTGIDESIRLHDKLLLVLSQTSVKSQWVEQEVETALAKEREQNRIVLFPIRLDDTVMQINIGWPAYLRNTRNIGDFTRWKDHDSYQKTFDRLLRDLKAEDKKH